jgi:hypothetical protein
MFGTPISGRIRFVAHAVREICNRLPDAVSGSEVQPRVDYVTRLDEIARVWHRDGLSLDGTGPELFSDDAPSSAGPERVAINRALFVSVAALVRDHSGGRRKPEETAGRLFEAIAPENRALRETLVPVIRQWTGMAKWSVGRAHDWKLVDGEYPEDELQRQFDIFETTLQALMRGFFQAADDLDEILEDTNS